MASQKMVCETDIDSTHKSLVLTWPLVFFLTCFTAADSKEGVQITEGLGTAPPHKECSTKKRLNGEFMLEF